LETLSMRREKDGRCASVKSIVSCRHRLCIFNTSSLQQMCLASDKEKNHSGVDSDGHRGLVISSGTMNTGQTSMFKKEKKRN
jgi:hypothetical protein